MGSHALPHHVQRSRERYVRVGLVGTKGGNGAG